MLKIIIYPDTALRRKTKPVKNVDGEIKSLIREMMEAMVENDGLGLAAPQVGVLKNIITVSPMDKNGNIKPPMGLVNPEIYSTGGSVILEEGCLSLPGVYADVERPENIRVRFLNENNQKEDIAAEGWLARAILHETDHLKGKIFWDRLGAIKRDVLKRKFRKLMQA